jgi:hypothetical protein
MNNLHIHLKKKKKYFSGYLQKNSEYTSAQCLNTTELFEMATHVCTMCKHSIYINMYNGRKCKPFQKEHCLLMVHSVHKKDNKIFYQCRRIRYCFAAQSCVVKRYTK